MPTVIGYDKNGNAKVNRKKGNYSTGKKPSSRRFDDGSIIKHKDTRKISRTRKPISRKELRQNVNRES